MKAILLSIKPKWVAKILNGEKTIEIRKTYPKCDLPIEVYIYCTKDNDKKHTLYQDNSNEQTNFYVTDQWKVKEPCWLNGKVVAKFTLNKIRVIGYPPVDLCEQDIKESCLSEKELLDYSKEETIYGWCIDSLEIFDRPKELEDFNKKIIKGGWDLGVDITRDRVIPLTKAPQSWCYVEVE